MENQTKQAAHAAIQKLRQDLLMQVEEIGTLAMHLREANEEESAETLGFILSDAMETAGTIESHAQQTMGQIALILESL